MSMLVLEMFVNNINVLLFIMIMFSVFCMLNKIIIILRGSLMRRNNFRIVISINVV